MNVPRFPTSWFATLILTALFAGCATRSIDWGGRVGHYTFDQAIAEIGPPDKQAKLTDGTLVAEWLTRRGYHQIYATGGHFGSPWQYGYGYPPTYVDTYSPDYFLRLTFAADGQLQAWKKFAK
jgi:hypothetical protein